MDEETLHSIDTRLSLVEAEVHSLASTNKWVRGIAVVIVMQIVLGAVGYGKLSEQVDSLHIDGLEVNVNTALQVLGDHGTELAQLRGEMSALRVELNTRTADRFTGKDADRLDRRLIRLEDKMDKVKR